MDRHIYLLAAALATATSAGLARAAMIDMTAPMSSATINGAIFETSDQIQGGTGVFNSFLRVQANGTEQGYNTSGSPLPFDDKAGSWTHDLQMMDIRGVVLGDTGYAAFMLDVNENNGATTRYLSLDSLQIYTSPTPGQTTTNVASLGTLRYDMDAGGDNWIKIDSSLASGSGVGDMIVYVPATMFVGVPSTNYVYLYCSFGNEFSSDGGFEEWDNFGTTQAVLVPSAGPLALLSLGGLLVASRRR
jgi:hypothetical protein